MNLSTWRDGPSTSAAERFLRERSADAVLELLVKGDPIVVGQVLAPAPDGKLRAHVLAATEIAGLVTVRIETDATPGENASLRLIAEPWAAVAGSLSISAGAAANAVLESAQVLRGGAVLMVVPFPDASAFYLESIRLAG